MGEDSESAVRQAFRRQAEFCRRSGSPLTGAVLDAIAASLDRDTAIGRRALEWPGDASEAGDVLSLRFAAGLHALARSGDDEALSAAYRGEGDVAAAVAGALANHGDRLSPWLDSPPQTNEPGRAALVMAGLLAAASRHPMPIDLLEIGSSAGLVLNLNRYRYDLGGVRAGDGTSPLLLAPEWHGPPPPAADVQIVAQRGVDRQPVYLSTPEAAERLIAYVWADQRERIGRLEAAIGLARAFPPPVVAGDAADWVEAKLTGSQATGVLRILFHTITLQYLDTGARDRVVAAIARAGAAATDARPFGWLSFEWNAERETAELRLTLWPGGEERHLADAHPHGGRVEWLV